MPIPQGPSEQQLFEAIRDKQSYRHLRYKATCLVVVGISLEREEQGYPFWYSIQYLNLNPKIKNPTPDIAEQGHRDWQPWYRSRAEDLMGKSFEDPERSTFYVKRGPYKGTRFDNAEELHKLIESGEIDLADVYENVRTEESSPVITDKTIQLLRESPKFFSEADPSRPELTKDYDYEALFLEIDYPIWLRNKKALVPKTRLNKFFNPETDVPKGMDITEARLRAIEQMTRVIRDEFWSIRIPTPKSDPAADKFFHRFTDVGNPDPEKIQENWLHKQIEKRLANFTLTLVKGQAISPIGVGVIEPRGIDQIFTSEKQAIDAVAQFFAAQQPMAAAAMSNKRLLEADYYHTLVKIADLLDTTEENELADEIDSILEQSRGIRFGSQELISSLVRIANRLDEEGNREQAFVVDDVLLAIQASKYSDSTRP